VNRDPILLLLALCIVPSTILAQVSLNGQTAAFFLKSAPTLSPRSVNFGRPSFGWQSYLFVDGRVTDKVAALSNVRLSDNESINFDYLAIQLTDLTPLGLNLMVGRFNLPFGNLGERRFPRRNPLFGLPLIHEYRTALPNYLTTEAYLVAYQGRGNGMRLLDLGVYDVGVMLYGSLDIVDYALAVTSGTISATSYGTENSNSSLGQVLRLAVTPMTGLTIGGAYAWGAYLAEPDYPVPHDVNRYMQKGAEIDFEFSRGHAVINAEAVYNTWPVPLSTGDKDLKVFGYNVEGKYTLMPRIYVALRVGGLRFGRLLLGQTEQLWDYDVNEWEAGLGYFLDRNVVFKLVRRETRIHGGTTPKDNLTVLQLAVAY
jgi:hypothetical protein